MCKTPILTAIEEYISQNNLRLHTPGHAGENLLNFKGFEQILSYDITEIRGLESLFESRGAIRQSETWAAKIIGANSVVYSASGSTPLIQAALSVARLGGRKVVFLGPVHKSAINACILLDIMPVFADFGDVEALLKQDDVGAVFVTNPTYCGEIFAVDDIVKSCKTRGIPLIVDSAHGAHLQFFSRNVNQKGESVDTPAVIINSAHKTLPALTGGAWAQIFDERFSPEIFKEHMAIFASTSPSYPILLSLELCLNWLNYNGANILKSLTNRALEFKKNLVNMGFFEISDDPLRATISAKNFGITGFNLQNFLREYKIYAEMADFDYVILLLHPNLTAENFKKLEFVFCEISQKYKNEKIGEKSENFKQFHDFFAPKMVTSPREAHFANREKITVESALNRTAAQICGPTPPGIPLTVPGSKICKKTQNLLKNYGILEVLVVK